MWRERALRHLNALESRIQALNHKMYWGCGYHYAYYDDIQSIRQRLHQEPFPFWMQAVLQVRLKMLTLSVRRSEYSATHPEWRPEECRT